MATENLAEALTSLLQTKRIPYRIPTETSTAFTTDDPFATTVDLCLIAPGAPSLALHQVIFHCLQYQGKRVFLTSCYSKYLTVPSSLRGEVREFVNQVNASLRNCWLVYQGPVPGRKVKSELRLSRSLMVSPQWDEATLKGLMYTQIVGVNEQFIEVLNRVLEFFQRDTLFREQFNRFKSETSRLEQLPILRPFLSSKNIQQMTDTMVQALTEMQVKDYIVDSRLFSPGIVTFSIPLSLSRQDVSLQVTATADQACIDLRFRIMYRKESLSFPTKIKIMKAVLTLAKENLNLPYGFYTLSSSFELSFSAKAVFCCVVKPARVALLRVMVNESVSAIAETVKSFLTIIQFPDEEESYEDEYVFPVPVELVCEGVARTEGVRVEEGSEVYLIIRKSTVRKVKESVPNIVWEEQILRTVPGLEKDVNRVLITDVRTLVPPLKESIVEDLTAFFQDLAAKGLWFRRLPLRSVYIGKSGFSLAPDFASTEIGSEMGVSNYMQIVRETIETWNSGIGDSDRGIAYIDPKLFRRSAGPYPTKTIQTEKTIYITRYSDTDVVLKLSPSPQDMKISFLMSLNHENLAKVFGFTEIEGRTMQVRELCERNLETQMQNMQPLDLETRFKWIKDVAEGMHYLHQNGLYHLALKPGNVLFTSENVVKVVDFGLFSKKVGSKREHYLFSSPELLTQSSASASLDFFQNADIWSFGVLMHYLLISSAPFSYFLMKIEDTKLAFAHEIGFRARRPLVSEGFEAKYPALVHLMRSCLNKSPGDRPNFSLISERLKEIHIPKGG